MRRLVIPLLFSCMTAVAQNIKQEINSIKQNTSYMNAEATGENRNDAFAIAVDELVTEACNHFNAELPQEKIINVVKSLEVKRGDCLRVFVYALVSDIEQLVKNVAVKPSQTVSQSVPTQTLPAPVVKTTAVNITPLASVTSVFSRMNTLTEIKSLLREYKPEGKVTEYDWVKSLSVDADACIVVFRGENIVAILQQEQNGKRINYMTNSEDNLGNYSGCRAIWYK